MSNCTVTSGKNVLGGDTIWTSSIAALELGVASLESDLKNVESLFVTSAAESKISNKSRSNNLAADGNVQPGASVGFDAIIANRISLSSTFPSLLSGKRQTNVSIALARMKTSFSRY